MAILVRSSTSTEPLDRLKYLPLVPVDNPDFGTEQSSDQVLLHRAWLGADPRFAESARALVEVGYLDQSGREGEPESTGVNRLDLLQGFADVSAPIAQ